MQAAEALDTASALDKKTKELAYIAVLGATGNTSGIPFHVLSAKSHGASRQEVLSAVLIGLPAAGSVVIASFLAAVEAYDGQNK
jgi:AhpD family alkylhydroperoxidase